MGSAFELLALCRSGAAQWERVGTGFVGLALGLSSVLSVSLPYSFLTLLLVPNIDGCPLNCGFCIYLSSSTQSLTFFLFFLFWTLYFDILSESNYAVWTTAFPCHTVDCTAVAAADWPCGKWNAGCEFLTKCVNLQSEKDRPLMSWGGSTRCC